MHINSLIKNLYFFLYITFIMKLVFYIRFLHGKSELKNTALFVDHFYKQDLEALKLSGTYLQIVPIEASSTFGLLRRVYRNEIRGLWQRYDTESEFVLRHVRNLMGWLVAQLIVRADIKAIIVPNDNYFWIREFILSCRERGLPVVLLDKEGMISPYHFESESLRSQEFAPPICDYVFVWSERKKDFWRKCGVAEDKIYVTGMARSDLLQRQQTFDGQPEKLKVVIFTYALTAYIPHEEAAAGFDWKEQRDGMHEVIKQVALMRPGVEYIVKCHPQQTDINAITNYFGGNSNVTVVGGSSRAMDLISRSDYVVCFQSTVMIEAMILSKPVIYAGWSELENMLADKLLQFRDVNGVKYVNSQQEFLTAMIEMSDEKRSVEYSRNEISKYVHQPDGNTANRIMQLLQTLCID